MGGRAVDVDLGTDLSYPQLVEALRRLEERGELVVEHLPSEAEAKAGAEFKIRMLKERS